MATDLRASMLADLRDIADSLAVSDADRSQLIARRGALMVALKDAGATLAEIAEVAGISGPAVQQALNRARRG